MINRFSSKIIVVLLLTSLSSLKAEEPTQSCMQKFKIGVSLPLGGGPVSSGRAVMNSIRLADELFDKNNCVDFVFEDDQLQPKNTVTNVFKFLNVDHVDGLIVYGTGTSIAVGDTVDKSKVPMVALSILDRVVENRKFIVKHWCTAEKLTEAVSREVKNRGYESVGIISSQNDAMLGLRDLYLKGKYSEVDLNEEYVASDNDFRASILKILRSKPSAVYVLLYPPQTGVFMKQLRELNYKGDAFGVHNIEDPAEVKASNGKMLGMWLANGDESHMNYRKLYLDRFKEETSLGGGSGFDVAKMMIEASQMKVNLNEHLHSVKDFSGAFGVYSATKNNDFDFGAVIKSVREEGFENVK